MFCPYEALPFYSGMEVSHHPTLPSLYPDFLLELFGQNGEQMPTSRPLAGIDQS